MLLLLIANGHVASARTERREEGESERVGGVSQKGSGLPLLQHIWALYQAFN